MSIRADEERNIRKMDRKETSNAMPALWRTPSHPCLSALPSLVVGDPRKIFLV